MEDKRVLVIVPFPVGEEHLALRREQSASAGLGSGIAFDYRPVKVGGRNLISPYEWPIGETAVLEAGLAAADEGYDAVCVDTTGDTGVAALRAILDVPVVGAARASFLTAMLLGDRFSIVAMWDRWNDAYRRTLDELGIGHKLASVRDIGATPDNRSLMAGKEDAFPRLAEAARLCVDKDGADVICLGSTTMHQAHAYLKERLEVPVIDPGPLACRIVEALLGLGLSHGRRADRGPTVRVDDVLRAMTASGAGSSVRVRPPDTGAGSRRSPAVPPRSPTTRYGPSR